MYLALLQSYVAVMILVWGMARPEQWRHLPSTGAFKDFAAGISSVVTAGGVIVAGFWTYFKFIKGRTYRPRLAVELAAQWRNVDGSDLLHVRVRVTNIGASMVDLNQYGSGLQVAFPADPAYNEIGWKRVRLRSGDDPHDGEVDRVFEVLTEHQWIESGETVSDDLLLDVDRPPSICMLELRLLYGLSGENRGQYREDDIEVFARQIIPTDSSMIDTMASKTS